MQRRELTPAEWIFVALVGLGYGLLFGGAAVDDVYLMIAGFGVLLAAFVAAGFTSHETRSN